MTTFTATYSPDDNKLRLYASSRLDAETYARVKAAGFKWAPKQGLFVAPAWTPSREDLLIELAGAIDDEDKSLTERAEERAERFEDYSDKRERDAESARNAVKAIADNIPFGQPILVGHHSERHARKDAERIENGMRKAVKMWETSKYWTERAAGAIRHAKYKELPAVRARRIKGIESELRKLDRSDKESAAGLALWELVDKPEKWKQDADSPKTREERAAYIAGRGFYYLSYKDSRGCHVTAYDALRLPAESRYESTPKLTVDEVIADIRACAEGSLNVRARWRAHYQNRLTYERAMLAESGGIATDKTGPEKGGGCRCWASPSGGWSYIQKVNRVSVTVLDNWGNGGANFTRTIPFDELRAVMTAAQVAEAKAAGRVVEMEDGCGFFLHDPKPAEPETAAEAAPAPIEENQGAEFDAMRETLKAGVKVVVAPQLFPTPPDLAERMADLAGIKPGHRILEPSAGTGNLIRAMLKRAGDDGLQVCAVEINDSLAMRLTIDGLAGDVTNGDFLQCNGELGMFDRIVMNPPFKNGDDIKHIKHALTMLKPGGRLVALCANGPRQREALQPLADTWDELPPDSFKSEGTGVNVALLVIEG